MVEQTTKASTIVIAIPVERELSTVREKAVCLVATEPFVQGWQERPKKFNFFKKTLDKFAKMHYIMSIKTLRRLFKLNTL